MANPNAVPPIFDKDPEDELDFGIDWEKKNWLQPGELVVSSTWEVPTGITKMSDGITGDGKKTFLWLSDGTPKKSYRCVNSIVTSSTPARKARRTIIIQVLAR